MGLMSRRKGKRGECEAVQLLIPLFPLARSKRAGGETTTIDRGRDILGTPGFSVQVKRMARPNVYTALDEAGQVAAADEIPLALTRRDRGPWLATLPAADLIALLVQLERLRCQYVGTLTQVPTADAGTDGR